MIPSLLPVLNMLEKYPINTTKDKITIKAYDPLNINERNQK